MPESATTENLSTPISYAGIQYYANQHHHASTRNHQSFGPKVWPSATVLYEHACQSQPYLTLALSNCRAKGSTYLFVDLSAPPFEALHPTRENNSKEDDHDTKGKS